MSWTGGLAPLHDTGEAGPWTRVPGGVEWRRDPYSVSHGSRRASTSRPRPRSSPTSAWAAEIGEPLVRRSIEGSIAFGVYDGDEQVGFARVVTDRATFAWVGDVFILDSHRGLGLALWLSRCMVAHPDLQGLRRWALDLDAAPAASTRRSGSRPSAHPETFMEIARPGRPPARQAGEG